MKGEHVHNERQVSGQSQKSSEPAGPVVAKEERVSAPLANVSARDRLCSLSHDVWSRSPILRGMGDWIFPH